MFVVAQKAAPRVSLLKTISGDIIDFTIDNLGNLYTLSRSNQLKKLNVNGDSVGVFNDVRKHGRLYSIDASNPLKILLYYKDFGNIVMLDRFLNVLNTISLRKVNIFQVKAICQSYDNGIWVYDEQDARLKKINDEGVIVDQTADFRLFMQSPPAPVQISDQDRLVYLYDPNTGLFIFDYFGTLKNKVALLGWEDFQVYGGKIFGRNKNTILQYTPGSLNLQEQTFSGLPGDMVKIKISQKYLYCLKDDVIRVYSF